MSASMEQKQNELHAILRRAPVIAVVVIDDASIAVPLARALVAGGIPAIEVTLRTSVALAAIRAIADQVPDALVGAGTVVTPADLFATQKAGAVFAVSPGSTPALLAAAEDCELPYLPASATASEAMALYELGYRLQKCFPAQYTGGESYLRALSGPLPGIRFCPTGGISVANAGTYLSLPNVVCVGGSWLTPADLLRARDWAKVESLARAASQLGASASH